MDGATLSSPRGKGGKGGAVGPWPQPLGIGSNGRPPIIDWIA